MTCKPRPISGNLPFDAIAKDYNRYCGRIIGNAGGLFLQPETIAFVERVVADGGTVEDIGFLNSFIVDAKANNYFSDIVAAYSPSWGVKGTITASKLYSVGGGSACDLEQVVGVNQPAINTGDLVGRTRLLFDGLSDFMTKTFTWGSAVRTIAMGGFEQESWTFGRRITTDSLDASRIRQDGATPQLSISDGLAPAGIKNSAAVIGTPVHFNGIFDGASSEILINNANSTTGDIGVTKGDGLTLGAGFTGATPGNFSCGMVVLLTAANDAGYAAKVTALYNFSKSAYGTP